MNINKVKALRVLRVLCCVGYGVFICSALLRSFDAYAGSAFLSGIGRIGLGLGSATMFIYVLQRSR